jgi:hypothetical protein
MSIYSHYENGQFNNQTGYCGPTLASVTGVYCSGDLCHYNNEFNLSPDTLPYGSGITAHNHRIAQNPLDDNSRQRGYCAKLSVEKRTEYSIAGAMGEVVFALAAQVPFDPFTGRGADFQINGRAVEIKTSAKGHPNLLVSLDLYKREPKAVYVAVQKVSEYVYRIIGWIEGERIPKVGRIQDPYKVGPSYCVEWQHLRPFKRLIGPPA